MRAKQERSANIRHEQLSGIWIPERFVLPFTHEVKGRQRSEAA